MSETTPQCACTEQHHGHICLLKSAGKLDEVKQVTDHPTVLCFICGCEANCADNVCSPMPIGET